MARLKAMAGRLSAPPPRLRPPPKEALPFYRSAAWRQLVESRKLDADYFAARARAKAGERVILDHVRELRDGGAALDPANTQWLTMSEHAVKTAKARAKRATGGR